jgi:polar amino acid transport system ATP-binding protein
MKDTIDVADNTAAKVLQVQGVSKSFGSNQVLRDVSLDLSKGEVLCLLGPSGCGKSTLLRCINWLETPDAGSIRLNSKRFGIHKGGAKMGDADLARMRARIGMVFQHFALWPHLSVIGNIIESPIHVQKRNKQEVREEALALLAKVGLQDKADMYPASLSGGQKQRVGIARALAMKPDILLFDEPTSALDPMLVGEVLEVMREMEFARQVASRIIFMDSGEVVETGQPGHFFSAPQTLKAQQFLTRFHQRG